MSAMREPAFPTSALADVASGLLPTGAAEPDMCAVEVVRATINGLFAAGLELCAARRIIDGEAADRIDRAVARMDEAIACLRSGSFAFALLDLTEPGSSEGGSGSDGPTPDVLAAGPLSP